MSTKIYNVIGLMSGTSLDGLDIAHCSFTYSGKQWNFTINKATTIPYPNKLKESLANAIHVNAPDLLALHNFYGTWLGKRTKEFIVKHNLEADFIASHGHTVFHQPQKGITCQIGSGQHLANASELKVVCDFRTLDVALGGQGAPLVPIGDKELFSEYDFCLNLGGIANISFTENGNRIAFDVCPVNMMLSYITEQINLPYDDEGKIAATGICNNQLLNTLNSLPFYQKKHPKSLGFEWFQENIMPVLNSTSDTHKNILNTLVLHIASQLANTISLHANPAKENKILITGGGTYNTFLINTLKSKLPKNCIVIVPDNTLINYKEALVFAFMGVLRVEGKTNCLKSVTGAKKDSSSGVIFYPS